MIYDAKYIYIYILIYIAKYIKILPACARLVATVRTEKISKKVEE